MTCKKNNNYKQYKTKTKKQQLEKKYKDFVENVTNTFIKEMEDGQTVGSIPEIYDSREPHIPRGAFAQGWSVAEVFRIILKNS